MSEIVFNPIGIIHSPFTDPAGTPIQPAAAVGVRGNVEIDPEFADGLKDLDGFSHIILLYHFHRSGPARLRVVPYLDTEERGVFATRAPVRPNPLGLSVVRLLSIEGTALEIENVDMLDGTPLLDIKPYVPAFDGWKAESVGWLSTRHGQVRRARADHRFGAG